MPSQYVKGKLLEIDLVTTMKMNLCRKLAAATVLTLALAARACAAVAASQTWLTGRCPVTVCILANVHRLERAKVLEWLPGRIWT